MLSEFAQDEARRLGHTLVGTEYILLGILRHGESVAAKVLNLHGVTLDKAREETETIVGKGNGSIQEIPFTPRAKRILDLSVQQAKQLGDMEVATEHILLGLIAEGDGVAMRVLEKLNVDLKEVKTDLLNAMGK